MPPDRIAWRDENSLRALYLKSWDNPHPDKMIETIDFISTKKLAAPFLVALTVE